MRVSEKVVARLMRELDLVAKRGKKRRHSSYKGEISDAPENLVKRDFHADAPNKPRLTDITEFRIPAGKVYPSPVADCFDGMAVSWAMSTSPNAELANAMLDAAGATLSEDEHPVGHTDRGAITAGRAGSRGARGTASRGRCRRRAAPRTTAPARASSGA